MTGYCQTADVTGRFPTFTVGKITTAQVQAWINETSAMLDAEALARGYDVSGLANTSEPYTILTNINRLAAQVLLGEAIQSQMGLSGEWKLLTDIRAERDTLMKAFRNGAYDKLFLGGAAKTLDAGAQLGGFVPGAAAEPGNKYNLQPMQNGSIFRRGQNL